MLRLILAAIAIFCCLMPVNSMNSVDAVGSSKNLYFPQNLGDEHIYDTTGPFSRSPGYSADSPGYTDRITQRIGTAYLHTNYWGDGNPHALIANKKGLVIEPNDGKRFIWYRFSDKEFTISPEASVPSCVSGAILNIVSRAEIVEVPAGRFENCVKITFSSNCSDGGIIEQWFAPNVGLVKFTAQSFAGPRTGELTSAIVAGVNYPQSNSAGQ